MTTNGGIYNAGTLSLDHSAVISNMVGSPGNNGGGLFTSGQALTVTDSLISGNYAIGFGGGIDGEAGSVTIVGSTIVSNSAEPNGGGLDNSTTLSVYSSTIANNTAFNGCGLWTAGVSSAILLWATTVNGNIKRRGLAQLLRHPGIGRMSSGIDVHDPMWTITKA